MTASAFRTYFCTFFLPHPIPMAAYVLLTLIDCLLLLHIYVCYAVVARTPFLGAAHSFDQKCARLLTTVSDSLVQSFLLSAALYAVLT